MWQKVSPERSNDVNINVNSNSPFCTTQACFVNGLVEINFQASWNQRAETVPHEFGHYVAWTYGDLDPHAFFCSVGVNESGPLNESIGATVSALVMWTEMPGLHYGVTTNSGARIKHFSTTTPLQMPTTQAGMCPSGDPWGPGRFFDQAIWEFVWNRNCETSSGCSTSTNTFGSELGWSSAATARAETLRAIAFALAATPAGTTYRAFASNMFTALKDHNSTVANRFRQILGHHGLSF